MRAFRDASVPHPSGSVDPARDAQAMEDELILADLGVAERRLERLEQGSEEGNDRRPGSRTSALMLSAAGRRSRTGRRCARCDLAGDDAKRLRGFQFLSAKPLLLVINLDEADLAAARSRTRRRRRASTSFLSRAATGAVAVCAKIELEIAQLDAADAAAFLADLGLHESGLDRVIRAELRPARLHLVLHRRRGRMPRVVDSARHVGAGWRPAKSTATSQRGFIRAEVVALRRSCIARGSLAACRDHGEVRLEGKEYVVPDGDVINFRHAT